MFAQFFGNYLLNRHLVSPEHLSDVFRDIKNTRIKLGTLAVKAGRMTAAQVEKAHTEQQRTDKKIGDIMIEMGCLDREQLNALLSVQPAEYMLLGQLLTDNGYMTTSQFETALSEYKSENGIRGVDLCTENSAAEHKLVKNFYNFGSINASSYMTEYVYLLFKNLIRFIGSDFTPMDAHALTEILSECVSQRVEGSFSAITAVDADAASIAEFASRFANERLSADDEYVRSCVNEFISLHNELFSASCLGAENVKTGLRRRNFITAPDPSELEGAYVIPVNFSFGTVNFIVAM